MAFKNEKYKNSLLFESKLFAYALENFKQHVP